MTEINTRFGIAAIVEDNIACLRQGAGLAGRIGTDHYTTKFSQCFNSSVGEHFRHILDHYQCLVNGLEYPEQEGNTPVRIDYDLRQRDSQTEQDPARAIERIGQMCSYLAGIDVESDTGLEVKTDSGANLPDQWAPSTLLRELQFLLSHTVHHYALIATMNAIAGIETPEDFGISPSTLAHRRKNCS